MRKSVITCEKFDTEVFKTIDIGTIITILQP